jgi:hypothetical protein
LLCLAEACEILALAGRFDDAAARYRFMLLHWACNAAETRYDFAFLAVRSGRRDLLEEGARLLDDPQIPFDRDPSYALLAAEVAQRLGRTDDERRYAAMAAGSGDS